MAKPRCPPQLFRVRAGAAAEQGCAAPGQKERASSAAGAETTIVGDCDRLLTPLRRSHAHAIDEHAAEMRAVVEAACEGDVGADRSAASGADKSLAARFTRSSQRRVIRVSPRSAKIFCRWRGETLSRRAISPDVRSGSSERSAMRRPARAWRSADRAARRPRVLAVSAASRVAPSASATRSWMWLTAKSAGPALRGGRVSEQHIGIAGQQSHRLRVHRNCGQHRAVEVGDGRREVPPEQGIVGQARRRAACQHRVVAQEEVGPAAACDDFTPALRRRSPSVVHDRQDEIARRIDGHLAAARCAVRST